MQRKKIKNPDWCTKHPEHFEVTCKKCHQASLDYTEKNLMELHEVIKSLIAHAKWNMEHGAQTKWGWTGKDFIVKWSKKT